LVGTTRSWTYFEASSLFKRELFSIFSGEHISEDAFYEIDSLKFPATMNCGEATIDNSYFGQMFFVRNLTKLNLLAVSFTLALVRCKQETLLISFGEGLISMEVRY